MAARHWSAYPCMLWPGRIHKGTGYATIKINSKSYAIHRLFGKLKFGKLKSDELICHHCDVRRCIQPMHLFVGSKGDNSRDMHRKGRASKENGKINFSIAEQMRREYVPRLHGGLIALGKKYGIGKSATFRVIKRKSWI